MLWPTVTELPRKLEPTTEDTFMQDLNAVTPPPDPQPADEPRRARRE